MQSPRPRPKSSAWRTARAAKGLSRWTPRRARVSGSLARRGEYTDGIERINIELSIKNKLQLVDALETFFKNGKLPLGKSDDANEIPSAELLEDRVQQALDLLQRVRERWTFVGEKLDMPLREAQHYMVQLGYEGLAEKMAD